MLELVEPGDEVLWAEMDDGALVWRYPPRAKDEGGDVVDMIDR